MANHICPHCKKEFVPRNIIHTHTYCSRNCAIKALRERVRINREIRESLGVSTSRYVSKYKKVDE